MRNLMLAGGFVGAVALACGGTACAEERQPVAELLSFLDVLPASRAYAWPEGRAQRPSAREGPAGHLLDLIGTAQGEAGGPVAGDKENPIPESLRYQGKTDWHMVAIEALVVEVSEERMRQLGFKFGMAGAAGQNLDGIDVQLGNQGSSPVPVPLLNKGAEGATSVGFADRMPGLGISLVGIDVGSSEVAARLRALVDRGEAVVRTRPIGVALNKTQVVIETVDEIPYIDTDANGKLGIQKKTTGVKLVVTPTIELEAPGSVTLDIANIEVSSGSRFITLQNVNRPVVNVSRTHTRITLREGETFIVGGLKTRRKMVGKEKVPILGSIPVVKWLFSSRSEIERNMDVLFFITPKILAPGENFLLPYDFENRKPLGLASAAAP